MFGVKLPHYDTAVGKIGTLMTLLRPLDGLINPIVAQCPVPLGKDLTAVACSVGLLRQDLFSRLRSIANAPGSIVQLGGAQNVATCAQFAGISGPLTTAAVVQAVSAELHAAFNASGLPAALATFADSLGKKYVRLFPAVLASSGDDANLTTRQSIGFVHLKPCFYAHYASGSREGIIVPGFVRKPEYLREDASASRGQSAGTRRFSPEIDKWCDDEYQKQFYRVSGLKEIEEWDTSPHGPLLLDRIPGCNEEDGVTLWVVVPAIAFHEGDMESLWLLSGLIKYRCWRCSRAKSTYSMYSAPLPPGSKESRDEVTSDSAVRLLHKTLARIRTRNAEGGRAGEAVGLRRGITAERETELLLEKLGYSSVVPAHSLVAQPTIRLPFSLPPDAARGPTSRPFAVFCQPDPLHLIKQGLYLYLSKIVVLVHLCLEQLLPYKALRREAESG